MVKIHMETSSKSQLFPWKEKHQERTPAPFRSLAEDLPPEVKILCADHNLYIAEIGEPAALRVALGPRHSEAGWGVWGFGGGEKSGDHLMHFRWRAQEGGLSSTVLKVERWKSWLAGLRLVPLVLTDLTLEVSSEWRQGASGNEYRVWIRCLDAMKSVVSRGRDVGEGFFGEERTHLIGHSGSRDSCFNESTADTCWMEQA